MAGFSAGNGGDANRNRFAVRSRKIVRPPSRSPWALPPAKFGEPELWRRGYTPVAKRAITTMMATCITPCDAIVQR
jgi:hypothetical protein